MRVGAVRALAMAVVLVASCAATPLPDSSALPRVSVDTPETQVDDAQVAGLIQQLEQLQGLEARDKRAVNALLGGSGGGFLNELNKGPTYSQLLGSSGGGFNKLGILSGLLGSSSGGGAAGGGDAGAGGGSDSGSILGLITPLLGSSSGPNAVTTLLDLGLVPLPDFLPGGDGADVPDDEVPGEAADRKRHAKRSASDDSGAADLGPLEVGDLVPLDAATPESEEANLAVLPVDSASSGGGGGGASAGASVSLGGLGGGDLGGDDLGATAGASFEADGGSSAGAGASAGAAGGSDSGSILGLVTPLLGSSSQGSAGDGTASGGSPGGSGIFGGGLIGTILTAVFSIKSFIFRKIVQLLTSSSGSPQAG